MRLFAFAFSALLSTGTFGSPVSAPVGIEKRQARTQSKLDLLPVVMKAPSQLIH